jgi:hypothetical protein
VKVWDVGSGECVKTLSGHRQKIYELFTQKEKGGGQGRKMGGWIRVGRESWKLNV